LPPASGRSSLGLLFDPEGEDMFFGNVGLSPEPHGVTSQKTAFFLVTAVITPNPTYFLID
jgi:hypothetical protein